MFRSALGQYLARPNSFCNTVMADERFVVIKDLYPKAKLHWLILPRSHTKDHPFMAFEDLDFLQQVREYADYVKKEALKHLQQSLPFALDDNWIKVGVHAVPTMDNLHIHVISKDMVSDSMKNNKHYNSFNTPFFVELDRFPIHENDAEAYNSYIKGDIKCWACGHSFGRQFKRLKEHLNDELGKIDR